MGGREAVLLVPGFFGFSSFGAGERAISYFAGVRHLLEETTGGRFRDAVFSASPPPTGSLFERVAALHDAFKALVVAHGFERIHVVGHSAGGVDARLWANPAFRWPGGANEADRESLRAHLGTLVTIAAPLFGTPVALRERTNHEALLMAVSLASILGKGHVGLLGTALIPMTWVLEKVRGMPVENARLVEFLADIDEETWRQIKTFLHLIDSDRQLMDDLTPESMERIAEHLRATDWPTIRHFVTVAPRPRLGLESIAQRALYARLYGSTRDPKFEPQPFPQGPWIGEPHPELTKGACPSDGVVPSASQTLTGRADGVVAGDHLDVIGHFEGSPDGAVVFRSGAAFDNARFGAFWKAVGQVL